MREEAVGLCAFAGAGGADEDDAGGAAEVAEGWCHDLAGGEAGRGEVVMLARGRVRTGWGLGVGCGRDGGCG